MDPISKNNFYGYNPNNIYLDNGASTLTFNSVKKAVDNYLTDCGSLYDNPKALTYEEAGEYIGNILNASCSDRVIFTKDTTDAVNKFARYYPWNKGKDKVLVSEAEHFANTLPWRKYVEVIELESEDFKISPAAIEEALWDDLNIKVIALPFVSDMTGNIIDAKSIYEICKKYGVYLFLDASQYAPHLKPSLDVCDFIAYSGDKMYAPFGGILAGRKDVLYGEEFDIIRDGIPNGIGAAAMKAAHKELFEEIGEENLERHNRMLCNVISDASDILRENGYNVYFDEQDNKIPIVLIDNTIKSNQETIELLQADIGQYQNVLVKKENFCTRRFIEKVKRLKNQGNKIKTGSRNEQYSLIRLSAGLINDRVDIINACRKLALVNMI